MDEAEGLVRKFLDDLYGIEGISRLETLTWVTMMLENMRESIRKVCGDEELDRLDASVERVLHT